MFSSKPWAVAVLWLLLALPLGGQNTAALTPTPKWEFGLRGGAGLNLIPFNGRRARIRYRILSGNNIQYGNSSPRPEIYIGSYATRNFRQHWSIRSELSAISQTYEGMSLSIGAFPRYSLTSWLNLETGLETRIPFSKWGRVETRFSVGAAFGLKGLEFNLRFAPVYQSLTPFSRGAWFGSMQAGASFKLASAGKLLKGKKG